MAVSSGQELLRCIPTADSVSHSSDPLPRFGSELPPDSLNLSSDTGQLIEDLRSKGACRETDQTNEPNSAVSADSADCEVLTNSTPEQNTRRRSALVSYTPVKVDESVQNSIKRCVH